MKEILVLLFLAVGSVFTLIAAVGVLKFPDLYIRMHASSKSGTLGGGCLMLAAGIRLLPDLGAFFEAMAVIVFFLLTAPVAAHVISRSAYLTGQPLWRGSVIDEPKKKHK